MRELQVVGMAGDGATLLCEDLETSETFGVPIDEKLQAAARGDLSRFGQLEIDMDPQLRPREIQARIRAGASIGEVAEAAGTTVTRVERYAYPVLLERSTMAERARKAHTPDDKRTIEQIVTALLTERGQQGGLAWDAFRENGTWVLVARWSAGRSENRALFTYHPGPGSGGVTARDDAARDLLNPQPRTLRTVATKPSATKASAGTTAVARSATETTMAIDAVTDVPAHAVARNAADRAVETEAAGGADAMVDTEQTVTDPRSGATPEPPPVRARTGTDDRPAAGSARPKRGHRPTMPSWEDVLLGTRSGGN